MTPESYGIAPVASVSKGMADDLLDYDGPTSVYGSCQ